MKYLFIIFILTSCGQSEKAYVVNTPVTNTKVIDSINLVADSVTNALADLPEYINSVKARISKLEKEKKTLQEQINEPIQALTANDYRSDDRDKVIAQLRKSLYEKETEIATLKKKITTDSVYRSRPYIGQKLIEREDDVMKPDDKSLVITLDKKIRGDGEIAETGITVYIMKYDKQAKKLKEYGNCDMTKMKGAVEASYYEGQYFFNGIEPGKYLIKVCSLFGNYMVINREDSYQKIEMKVSPPIQ